ncbi:MAG: tetratricopeptide repeat protein [Planctomycetia bacterium]|nr:tetratricopeptide repeat protein [Planctomycetia bacterium]
MYVRYLNQIMTIVTLILLVAECVHSQENVQEQPSSPAQDFKQAIRSGYYSQANEQLTSLLSVSPDDPELLYWKGRLLLHKNWCASKEQRENLKEDYAQSQSLFEKAIALDPDKPLYYHWLSRCFFRQKKYESALAILGIMEEKFPKYAETFAARGTLKYVYYFDSDSIVGDGIVKQEIYSDLKKAYKLSPNNCFVLIKLAQMYRAFGEWGRALAALNKCESLIVESGDDGWEKHGSSVLADVYSSQAGLYTVKNNPTEALLRINKAIALDPSDGSNYYMRACIEYQFKCQMATVKDDLELAKKLCPMLTDYKEYNDLVEKVSELPEERDAESGGEIDSHVRETANPL